ncbi:MAG TPA: hybrid sensor histidine kinase/response regulator, partial [Ignavibacteriaceae bacterium]|nr:hybrid sensor histidine kinase/response regulator [Ignavibacteriaceae bacterium]
SITWLKEIISLTRNNYGDVVKLASLTFDITEYKTLEENLKSSVDELKSLEASRIRFINILAHDLRAPFTSILGFAEILLNEPSLPDKDRKEYLTYIYDASQNQLGFTNYLLDWARLKSGTIKMETGRLRASDIVYNEVSNLTGNAVRKNIEIKTDISDDIYILADERLLGQVFSNLINNAIKYSKENSIIEVNGNIYNEKYAEFVVKDFGVGLTQEEKKKIFNLEESFTKEGTKGEKGTGLGLALVKEIILKHNGDIWFFSEENNGTEFHFIIPLASRMVLLVESDESVKSIINSIIKKNFSDIELIYADNGFEALNLLGEFFPVLIILNDKLPMMNGLQFIDSARSIFSGFAVPVIFLGDKKTMENMEKLTNKKSVFFSDIAIQENSLLKILNQLID